MITVVNRICRDPKQHTVSLNSMEIVVRLIYVCHSSDEASHWSYAPRTIFGSSKVSNFGDSESSAAHFTVFTVLESMLHISIPIP